MKKWFLAVTLLTFYFSPKAQSMKDLDKKITEIEDRIAIKNLVDTFSILADQKDIQKQGLLFTEDATVESFMQSQSTGVIKGRKQIVDAFTSFLKNFSVVYHINGQQTINLMGDKASAISYCAVTLIGKQNDKTMKTSFGIYYNDDFVKQNGHWLIAKRVSHFVWNETREFNQ
jgi:hypothetical protein